AKETPLEPLLDGQSAEELRPVFETRITRTKYRLARRGSSIDVAVNQGEVDTGRRSTPFCELTLELARGDVGGLFDAAREVAGFCTLHPAARTKPDRGYELLNGGGAEVQTAADIRLAPDMNAAAAFRVIARACTRQLVGNEAGMLRENPRALHPMRVGIRRLRTAISACRTVVAGERTEEMKRELKWIAGELAPARDADVFIAEVLKPLRAAKPDDPGIAWLVGNFEERRASGYERAAVAVGSERYRKL